MSTLPLNAQSPQQTFSDTVSIAATSAGVSGNISVPQGARLVGIDIAHTAATAAIITKIALSWPNSPQPLNFVPNTVALFATPGGAVTLSAAINLPLDVSVAKATTVTITVTSSANLTVKIGLRWL